MHLQKENENEGLGAFFSPDFLLYFASNDSWE